MIKTKSDLTFLTKEYLNKYFEYKDGILYYRNVRKRVCRKNWIVGGKNVETGYWKVTINGYHTSRSRIVFLMHHGYLPDVVDHIDRNRANDRIENLRACTQSENAKNRSAHKNKKTKYIGVSCYHNPITSHFKYKSYITINNLPHTIGWFDREDDAALAYNKFAVKYRGEFANLNILIPTDKKYIFKPGPPVRGKHIVFNLETGIFYQSFVEASKAYSLNKWTVLNRLKNKNNKHKFYPEMIFAQ